MTFVRAAASLCGAVGLVVCSVQPGQAQGRRGGGPGGAAALGAPDLRNADPMSGPLVAGAPFSADATTTVVQTLADGTRIEQKASAKFYRDSTGRVRREQTVIGLDALNPSGASRTVITFDSVPGDPMPYVLDPMTRTARQTVRGLATSAYGLTLRANRLTAPGVSWLNGDLIDTVVNYQGLAIPRRGVPNDVRPVEEMLATRQVEGVKATGRRTTMTIPQGRVGNDRPIQITDERWESPELGLLVSSRYSDPRTGVVEYKLTNISRTEPRADLFSVPSDYTVVQRPAPPTPVTTAPPPGTRGGRNPGTTAPPTAAPGTAAPVARPPQ
jgi:hypothetical protein